MTQKKPQHLKKADEVEGKLLVSKGPKDKRSGSTAFRLTHSDPSRRDSATIDLLKGLSYRVPEDVSVSDARVLLTSESWRFTLKDRPDHSAAQDTKGD